MLQVVEKDARWCCAMFVVAGVAVPMSAHAGDVHPTSLRIAVSDGFDSGVFLPDGTNQGDGRYSYRRSHYTGGSEAWSLSWDFSAVPADNVAAWLTGNFIVRNDSDDDLDFEIIVDMPLVRVATPAGYYGSASLTIAQGMMSALPEDQIYSALIDQGYRDGWYAYPYVLEGATNSDGAAVSGEHGGANGSIGIRIAFTLTSGGRATILSGWGVEGVGASNNCPADIDRDGVVGIGDLLMVISNWGPYEGPIVPADIDGNNYIGIEDVFEVIVAWGDCP